MLKINIIVFFTLFSSSFLLNAQVNDNITIEDKIDTIYILQKEIHAKYFKNPLKNKKYGVELNIFTLPFIDSSPKIYGGFSLFNIDRKAEIAFPISYVKNANLFTDISKFKFGCHYRRFLGKTQQGIYVSGLIQYTHYEGSLRNNSLFYSSSSDNSYLTGDLIGVGIGAGYRYVLDSGFYFGLGASLGRFLNKNEFYDVFFNFEGLKIGYAF